MSCPDSLDVQFILKFAICPTVSIYYPLAPFATDQLRAFALPPFPQQQLNEDADMGIVDA
jgi:hypothetical protein